MAENEIDVALTISRGEDDPLELEDPESGYEIVEFGPGGRTWRRDTVEGTYVHGRVLLNAVLESRTAVVIIRVFGDSWTEVAERVATLQEAVDQFAYVMTSVIDGVTTYHVCECADVAIAGSDTLDKYRIMANQQELVLTIPYDPVKVEL